MANTLRLIPALSIALVAPLSSTATVLPVSPGDAAVIFSWLGTTTDTYLLVHSPGGAELVMAFTPMPGAVSIVRGQGGTLALAHPTGSCVATAAGSQCAIERLIAEHMPSASTGVTTAALNAAVAAATTSILSVTILANDGVTVLGHAAP